MDSPAALAEAFRLLKANRPRDALEVARRAAAAHPSAARPRLAEGIALRMLGQLDGARACLAAAAGLDPQDAAVAYETGLVLQMAGDAPGAIAQFERARSLKPDFFAARFALAQAQQLAGRHAEAENEYVHALAADPHRADLLVAFGRYSASRGNFRRAASLFTEALRLQPGDEALPIYIAQSELLAGNWAAGWAAYARRPTRKFLEQTLAAQGEAYRLPRRGELRGRDVLLVAEQGLGDILFFLRWAPSLRDDGARLRFMGPPNLLPLLERTGLFESLHPFGSRDVPPAIPVIVGDLPRLEPAPDPFSVATLRIAPLPQRLEAWRRRLEAAGAHPWVGITWRAGMWSKESPHTLFKAFDPAILAPALRALGGTVVALQRNPEPGEIARTGAALGIPVHDFTAMNDDLEDALALVSLLDRHIGVSNTNMHLAEAAGKTADVLVPFPPEWRWRTEGDSAWFPGFRAHRQAMDGDWAPALASLVSATGGSGSRA